MSTSKVTSKGQATIPADVRARLGIKPGDSVEFTVNDAGEMVVRRAPRLSDLTGMIKVDPKVAAELAGKSWDDIRTRTWDEVIAERHRDRD
jgi:antitoxin PrlF